MPPTKKKSPPKSSELSPASCVRTGLGVAELKQSFLDNLFCGLGRVPMAATRNDAYTAPAMTARSIRDYCQQVWNVTPVSITEEAKQSYEQDRSR